MRRSPDRVRLAGMNTRCVMLDAAIDRSVIRGTFTAVAGERREFHDWLERSRVLQAMLGQALIAWRASPSAGYIFPATSRSQTAVSDLRSF
jgi:hypothetical protein